MGARKLVTRQIGKVWGRRDLPPAFGPVPGEPVGEIWFEDSSSEEHALLVKYLFTSEHISIQVHPDDASARAAGHPCGKEEAWLIVDAEPGAVIGMGLCEETGRKELRSAALDGRIEKMLDWKSVKAGDYFYLPAGTIHALGPGLSLIEVQQNADLTYRLYDYGRPRELHLDEGMAVAKLEPYEPPFAPYEANEGRRILAVGAFVLEQWTKFSGPVSAPAWLVPVHGEAFANDARMDPGSVWFVDDVANVRLDEGADILVAYPGGEVRA
jgi:mannose-6-phosphate isomerase